MNQMDAELRKDTDFADILPFPKWQLLWSLAAVCEIAGCFAFWGSLRLGPARHYPGG